MKFEYGKAYERHDMRGEIEVGTGILKVHDIFYETPEFMKQADALFCDPPCSKANLNTFYTKAEILKIHDEFDPFADRLFEVIQEIKPEKVYMELFASNKEDFIERLKKMYPAVEVDESYYYHNKKNKCWIVRAGYTELPHPEKPMDEQNYIEWIMKNVEFDTIADPCMGRGLVGFYANKHGKRFVGTELNFKRLAVCVERIKNGKL